LNTRLAFTEKSSPNHPRFVLVGKKNVFIYSTGYFTACRIYYRNTLRVRGIQRSSPEESRKKNRDLDHRGSGSEVRTVWMPEYWYRGQQYKIAALLPCLVSLLCFQGQSTQCRCCIFSASASIFEHFLHSLHFTLFIKLSLSV
jgi:hypothetical protein